MAAVYKLQDIPKLTGRKIFVDANVLIHLFWATGSWAQEERYAQIFSSLQNQSNLLFVDFLVLSEVVNRMLRTELKKHFIPDLKFKQFRNSDEGQQVLADIYLVVKDQVLSQFNVAGKAFSKTDLLNFLDIDSLDFMDKGILKICQDHNFVLLTHDKDFKNTSIDILTCNPAI